MLDEAGPPMFRIEPVHLQFSISNLAALAVCNNILVMALASGSLLRIDLNKPQIVDDIDLKKKKSDFPTVKKLFLDPTGSHLIVHTALGDSLYIHRNWAKARALKRLRGIQINALAWNENGNQLTTKEVLIAAADGSVYEICIEPTEDYFKREEKYVKLVHKLPHGQSICGIHSMHSVNHPGMRRVIFNTDDYLYVYHGKVQPTKDLSPAFTHFFDTAVLQCLPLQPCSYQIPCALSSSVVDEVTNEPSNQQIAAWMNGSEINYCTTGSFDEITEKKLSIALPDSIRAESITGIAVTKYHILLLCGNTLHALNLCDYTLVFSETIRLKPHESILDIAIDFLGSTFWLFSSSSIFEIVIENEARDIWKILIKEKSFDKAYKMAKLASQRDIVNIAHGDELILQQQYLEAAEAYGKSTKSFEDVALLFLQQGELDALRKYVVSKLSNAVASMITQRIMLATWAVELFMGKLNSMDDQQTDPQQLQAVLEECFAFMKAFIHDLEKDTIYEIIMSYGRRDVVIFFATLLNDHAFIVKYWIKHESWTNALAALNNQLSGDLFYKYSYMLVIHLAKDTVDVWMRHELDAVKLLPALLAYNSQTKCDISENQAIRYLLYSINHLHNTDSIVHNSLIGVLASHPSKDENKLLQYLKNNSTPAHYDPDFALRICLDNERVESSVFLFSSLNQFVDAVNLSLQHGNIELASYIADKPEQKALSKKLWLLIAKKLISESSGTKKAIQLLNQCDLLRIEDLISFFPEFLVIDDYREEICSALEGYSHRIDQLKQNLDNYTQTADRIDMEINGLSKRYAIVSVGEHCFLCKYPLLSRRFFVFPCQHTFHEDCLLNELLMSASSWQKKKVSEWQSDSNQDLSMAVKLEEYIGKDCVFCGDTMIESIDRPFLINDSKHNDIEWQL